MKGAMSMSEITYQQNGDYLIPNLTISQPERPIGKYGRIGISERGKDGTWNRCG